jgi:hypothetical protein
LLLLLNRCQHLLQRAQLLNTPLLHSLLLLLYAAVPVALPMCMRLVHEA